MIDVIGIDLSGPSNVADTAAALSYEPGGGDRWRGESRWCIPARPPLHPFDYAC